MTSQTPNPYKPPDIECSAVKSSDPPRSFRWTIIPAALSWTFGGTGLFSSVVGLVVAIPKDHPERWLPSFVCMTICGGCNLAAGTKWIRQQPMNAIILNIVGFAMLGVLEHFRLF